MGSLSVIHRIMNIFPTSKAMQRYKNEALFGLSSVLSETFLDRGKVITWETDSVGNVCSISLF